MTKERRQDILNKIEWEGGYEDYFIYYGADQKDLQEDPYYKALVNQYQLIHRAMKKFLEEE